MVLEETVHDRVQGEHRRVRVEIGGQLPGSDAVLDETAQVLGVRAPDFAEEPLSQGEISLKSILR